jgi:ectoine hydroxylase-related dioxygenase (phytanoyl-CoA dioxygenase family)
VTASARDLDESWTMRAHRRGEPVPIDEKDAVLSRAAGLQMPTTSAAMTQDERVQFERDGFLLVRSALSADEVAFAHSAVMRAYDNARERGELDAHAAMHRLSAVTYCPPIAFLLDHPATFRLVWSVLGWNVHVYHSHIDVHPPRPAGAAPHWGWHQDGGRQNRELETDPRPRMSVKLAYWLSDVSQPGRGNLLVVPRSHTTNWLDGPARRSDPHPPPPHATAVLVEPGDALFFDRRLWHVRSDNGSDLTRVAAFFGYTYRWVVGRDDVAHLPHRRFWDHLSPVQQQLLGWAGDGSGDHAWGHDPQTTPVYRYLEQAGLLDANYPPLIPDRSSAG